MPSDLQSTGKPRRSLRRLVQRGRYRDAYCVKLNDGTGYIVWPQHRVPPRGQVMCAIGLGNSAQLAWKSAWQTICAVRKSKTLNGAVSDAPKPR